jgi:WD40 repeat protein
MDRTVRVWNRTEEQEAHRLEGYTSPIWGMALSPDGRQALIGDTSGLLILWDLATGKEVRRFTETSDWGQIRGIRFLADGRHALVGTMAFAGGGLLLQVDLTTGKELNRLKGPSYHAQVALLPDGRHALTANGDRMVRVWSLPPVSPDAQKP